MPDTTPTPPASADDRLQQMKLWLEKAQAKEPSALDYLLLSATAVIRERAEYLLAKKFRFLGSRGHEVDSVVSDVWLKLKKHFQQKLPTSLEHLMALLALSVHHMLLDKAGILRRKDQRHQQLGLDSSPGYPQPEDLRESYDPQALAEFAEFQEQLWNKLEKLPEDQRRVFEMHYFLGVTQARIAADLQLHPRQVSRLWIRASGTVVLGWKEEQ